MTWDLRDSGVVELPGGRRVRGRRLAAPATPPPDWGLYLTTLRPHPPWSHGWVCWPDFALPLRSADARAALAEAWERCTHERVEIACGGGVGRTGTALAALAILDGLDHRAAVAWVRARYHPRAVETPWQRHWLARHWFDD